MHLTLIFTSFLLLLACSQSPVSSQSGTAANPDNPKASNQPQQPPPDAIKLVQREVIDKEGTQMVASTYLLPADWTVQDRLYWEYNDATVPVRLAAKMQSADGSMAIQIFPDIRSSWNTGPSGTYGYPPPGDIISGMKDLVRAERKGKDIRFVSHKILLDQPQPTPNGQGSAQAAVLTIAYDENGKTYEEEFYARLDIAQMITPTVMGNMQSVLWAASGMFACKAVKGKLEQCRKIANTVATSARLTKPFYNRLAQVIQLLSDQVYAKIYQAGQISRIISQTNDQMIANIDASYRRSQAASERTNNQFSDYMRGVDRYDDNGTEIQLPSGYSNAWINDRGEYLLTNTTGYDPSRDFNGSWKLLDRQ